MRISRLAIVALVFGQLCPIASAELAVEGRHFRVVCHFENERIARQALESAERVWPLASRFFGLTAARLGSKRLEIHLFRAMEDYAAAEWRLTGGRFRDTGAFTAYSTKAAYVALQPHCSDRLLERFGLPILTRIQLAHEACHVVCYHAVQSFRAHPLWYAEGFATWAANEVIVGGAGGAGGAAAGLDPFTARMMARLQALDRQGRLPSAVHVLSSADTNLAFYDRYALWWALFRELMEGPGRERFLEIAARAHEKRPGEDVAGWLYATIGRELDARGALQRGLLSSIRGLRPAWDEELRSLERAGSGWLQRAFRSTPAVAWRTEAPPAPPYRFAGALTVLDGREMRARLLLDRGEKDLLALEFVAGRGLRLVEEQRFGHGRTVLAEATAASCRGGRPVRFSVSIEPGRISVSLAGAPLLAVETKRPLTGAWGLGVPPGAAALWRLEAHPGTTLGPVARPSGELPDGPGKLMALIRRDPAAPAARAAVERLAQQGPDALHLLEAVVAGFARSRPSLARAAALRLGEGDEPKRLEALERRYRAGFPGEVRGAMLVALARRYPAHAERFHAALLDPEIPDKAAILEALLQRGVGNAVLRRCLRVPAVAAMAYDELVRRGEPLRPGELAVVARGEARRGFSPDHAAAWRARLARAEGWTMLEAVAGLVGDADPEVRDGARTLLMAVSGRDIAPDADLWRSWIAARRDRYQPPGDISPGSVGAAVLRGVAYLRARLLEKGRCEYAGNDWTSERRDDLVGATGLAVLALRAAGVARDDPAIRRAVEGTLLDRNLHGQLVIPEAAARYNYSAAILTMALAAVDPEAHRFRIQSLANRIAAGQLESGMFTYATGTKYEGPPEASRPMYRYIGDGSNTQYALLGLRAARRAGAEVRPGVWARSLTHYLESQDPWGGWGYGVLPFSGVERTMTGAGVAGLVICLEGIHGKDAARRIAASPAVRRGLVRQGQLLIGWGYAGMEHYGFYGVERACVLTGTRRFNDYDWYEVGVRDLLARQRPDGSWHGRAAGRPVQRFEYGPDIDTAYALLFLKRATTVVEGTRAGSRVACPPGPNRIRGPLPARWWPRLPEAKKPPPSGDPPGTLPK